MDVDRRKLTQFAGVFERMKEEHRVTTTDPRKFTRAHIHEFQIWMRKSKIILSTQEKYVQILDRLLQIFHNNVVHEMRSDPLVHLPKGGRGKAVRALSVEELQKVFDAAQMIQGYDGMVLRGFFAIAFGTGCRPKEVICAVREDLDMEKSQYYVRHPKGEGSWAEPQWIPIIRGDMIPRIQAFLEEWEVFCRRRGLETEYLFVNPDTKLPLSDYAVRRMKKQAEQISGVRFMLKDFRSTLASLSVQGDISRMNAVSLQLRHKSVDTTSNYYTRINKTEEIKNTLEDVWKDKKIE